MKVRYRKTFYAVSLLISDVFMLLSGLKLAFWLKFDSGLLLTDRGIPVFHEYAQLFGIVTVIALFFYRHFGLYMEERITGFWNECSAVVKGTTFTFVLLMALSFFYRGFSFSRGYMITSWVTVIVGVLIARAMIGYAYMYYRRTSNKYKEVLLVGLNPDSARYAIRTIREPRRCIRVIGVVDDQNSGRKTYKRLRVIGGLSEFETALVSDENINEVVVTSPHLEHKDIIKIMMLCDKHLVAFKWMPDILGLMTTQMDVRHELGLSLLAVKESPLLDWENGIIKRISDILLSASGILAALPLLLLTAIAIKIDSRGPIFYRQERVGEDGKTFWLIKFRTMRVGAEDGTGPVWTKQNDDRKTRIGGLMRRYNFDELPQLWNVLMGDMSLVGPRPERPHFVGQFKERIPRYMGRHSIKSGLTGWAQVNGLRGDTSIEERTRYDLYYLENWSILFDIKILFKTLFAFKNAY